MSITRIARLTIVLLLSCEISGLPSTAGSIIVGSVIEGLNATLDQQEVRPGATILNGDNLQVEDGRAVVGLQGGSRITLGKDTVVSFQKETHGVTAVVDHGMTDFFQPAKVNSPMRLQIVDVYVIPESGLASVGVIAMGGDTLIVSARAGSLRVEGGGRSIEVPEGKMLTLHSQPARAPQISGTTPRPTLARDLKIAAVTLIGAAGLALLVNHFISNASSSSCRELVQQLNPSPVVPSAVCP